MEDGLTESEPGRKPSNSAKSTHKCALALHCDVWVFGNIIPIDEELQFVGLGGLRPPGLSMQCFTRFFSSSLRRVMLFL
jgi:hypothetical protein